jgi:hypothetical protein
VALPLSGTFYALGFRVDISTNSRAVLEAAAESWGRYGPEFPSPPVVLHIVVRPGGDPAPAPASEPEPAAAPEPARVSAPASEPDPPPARSSAPAAAPEPALARAPEPAPAAAPEPVRAPTPAPAPEPVVRTQRHYFSIVSDRDNFAAYDSHTFFGYCFVTERTAADRSWFRFFYLETMAYMLLAQRYAMPLHAAAVAHKGIGALLYGHAGAGKSTLAWACARAGWTYITDDGAWLLPVAGERTVLGRCHQIRFKSDAPRLFPELQRYAARPGPNGKLSIEVPLADFPQLRTASRCHIACVVVLDRRSRAAACAEPVSAEEVAGLLLGDMPRYEAEVRARYETAVGKLLHAPCHRLTYDNPEDAIRVLTEILHSSHPLP